MNRIRLTVGICGLGLIGSSAARGLAKDHDVIGFDDDPAVAAQAHDLGIGTVPAISGLRDCDLVLLAAPTSVNQRLLADLIEEGSRLPVADLGSVKVPMEREWLARDPSFPFVGTHPMAGAEAAGIGAGSDELFVGAAWPVIVHDRTDPVALSRMLVVIRDLGGLPMPMAAETHDAAVALASHLPHLLAGALGTSVAASPLRHLVVRLAAGSFRDAGRVSGSPPDRTSDFLALNGPSAAAAARVAAAGLLGVAAALDADDTDAVRAWLTVAHGVRAEYAGRGQGDQVCRETQRDDLVTLLVEERDSGAVITSVEPGVDGWWRVWFGHPPQHGSGGQE